MAASAPPVDRRPSILGAPFRRAALLLLVTCGLAAPAAAVASGWQENPQSGVRLFAPYRVAPATGELRLGLELRLIPGWHVYWRNGGDAGYPPELDLAATPEIRAVRLLFPAPHRFDLPGGLVAFGYAGSVVYPVRATIAAAGRERLSIAAVVDYLVCEIDCVPYHLPVSFDLPLGTRPEPDPELEELLAGWEARVPQPIEQVAGLVSTARLDLSRRGDSRLEIRLDGASGDPSAVGLFLDSQDLFAAGRPRVTADGEGLRFEVPLAPRDVSAPVPASATFRYTVTGLTAPAAAVEAIRVAGKETAPREGAGTAGELSRRLATAFLGGFLLLLSPAPLALLLSRLAAARGAERGSVRRAGLTAAAGVLAGCWALAFAALLARRAGSPVGWGWPLARPEVLAGLAAVALLVSLRLWGLLGRAGAGAGGAADGLWLAAGALTPPFALPHDVPSLASAVDPALARGGLPVIAVATALAAGMALPYLMVVLLPGLFAPRSPGGAIAERPPAARLAPILGFLAAGELLWLLYLLAGLLPAPRLALVEAGLLGMALLAWLGRGRRSGGDDAMLGSRGAMRARSALLALALAAATLLVVWLARGPEEDRAATGAAVRAVSTNAGDGSPATSERRSP